MKEQIVDPATTFDKSCLSPLCKIINDQTHLLHNYVIILHHGHLNYRWCYLVTIIISLTHTHYVRTLHSYKNDVNVPYCKTARLQNTVIQSAITLSAVNHQMDDFMYYWALCITVRKRNMCTWHSIYDCHSVLPSISII